MGVNGIYGLSGSGLDVQSLVKAGMLTKQNEYDKLINGIYSYILIDLDLARFLLKILLRSIKL